MKKGNSCRVTDSNIINAKACVLFIYLFACLSLFKFKTDDRIDRIFCTGSETDIDYFLSRISFWIICFITFKKNKSEAGAKASKLINIIYHYDDLNSVCPGQTQNSSQKIINTLLTNISIYFCPSLPINNRPVSKTAVTEITVAGTSRAYFFM